MTRWFLIYAWIVSDKKLLVGKGRGLERMQNLYFAGLGRRGG